MNLLLLIPGVTILYIILAGLFHQVNVYRQTRDSNQRPCGPLVYEKTDANIAAIFWPVYLVCLMLLGCARLAPWIIVTVAMAREKRLQGKAEGITSTADYRKYKRWVGDYERNLHVGER